MADLFVKALIAQYALVTALSVWEGAWWKALYWASAAGISVAVLRMR